MSRLKDPYLHVFVLGLVFVYQAKGRPGEYSIEEVTQPIHCRGCLENGRNFHAARPGVPGIGNGPLPDGSPPSGPG